MLQPKDSERETDIMRTAEGECRSPSSEIFACGTEMAGIGTAYPIFFRGKGELQGKSQYPWTLDRRDVYFSGQAGDVGRELSGATNGVG